MYEPRSSFFSFLISSVSFTFKGNSCSSWFAFPIQIVTRPYCFCSGCTSHFLCDLHRVLNPSGLLFPQNEGVELNKTYPKSSEILFGKKKISWTSKFGKCPLCQKVLRHSTVKAGDPAVTLLGVCPGKLKTCPHRTCTQMFVVGLFIIIKQWIQPYVQELMNE